MSHLTNHFISIRTIQSVFAFFLTFIIKTKHSELYGIAITTIKLVHVHHKILKHYIKDLDQMTDNSPLLFTLNACKWEKQSKIIFFQFS